MDRVEQVYREAKNLLLQGSGLDHYIKGPGGGVFVWTSQGLVPELNDSDEVFRNIYIGNGRLAKDVATLQYLNVKLVVNAAQGSHFSQINTTLQTYQPHGINFYGVQALDSPRFKMAPYFRPVADVIERCLRESGVVYVHCHQGRSRSASLVLAYLMIHRRQGLVQALDTVRQRRLVTPNDGFLRELSQLEVELIP